MAEGGSDISVVFEDIGHDGIRLGILGRFLEEAL